MKKIKKELPRYPECFVCGKNNSSGTGVTFTISDEAVETEYITREKHNSYKGILHGGVISALLDECLGWAAAIKAGQMCVTGELNVRFIKPVIIPKKILVSASIKSVEKNNKFYTSKGVIRDEKDTILATAKGQFFPIPEQMEKSVFDMLEINDDPDNKITYPEFKETYLS